MREEQNEYWYNNGNGKVHPITDHEGPEEE